MNTLLKDIRAINLDRKGLFDGQAELVLPDESNCSVIHAILTPNSGPFCGAEIRFALKIPNNFPAGHPTAECLDKIFHPNVAYSGGVCFNMFGSDGWSQGYSLEAFVIGLLWLLSNPNPSSCLNGNAAIQDPKRFEEIVQMSLIGIPYRGQTFSILKKAGEQMELKLSDWLENGIYATWDTPRWRCKRAQPYVDLYNQLVDANQTVICMKENSVTLQGAKAVNVAILENFKLDTSPLPLDVYAGLKDPTLFTLSAEEAPYWSIIKTLNEVGPIRVTGGSAGHYNFSMSNIDVSGRFVDNHIEIDLKSFFALQNPTGSCWLSSPYIRCLAFEASERCMACLSSVRQILTVTDAQCRPGGDVVIFVKFEGSVFACDALLDKATIRIPFNLYRRIAHHPQLGALECLPAAETQQIRARLAEIDYQVIDVLPIAGGYNLRFARGGGALFMLGTQVVVVDLPAWVKLGQPRDEVFKVDICPSLKYLMELRFVSTHLKNWTQISKASRILPDGNTQTAVLVTACHVPIELKELQQFGDGWTLEGSANLDSIFSSPLVVLDSLIFRLTSFLPVAETLFARLEPEEAVSFFQRLATNADVRLASLHSKIPDSVFYTLCAPISMPTFSPCGSSTSTLTKFA
jgi:ubiquitin-protein ligase